MKLNAQRITLPLAIVLFIAALALLIVIAMTPPVNVVTWNTASELNTAGFNMLRGDSPDGPFTRINTELIPASPDPLVGSSYAYTDTNVVIGRTYYYQLVEIESGGSTNVLGVTKVTASNGLNSPILIIGLVGAAIIVGLVLWPRRSSHKSPST